jgi:hypothetical protein
MIEYIPVLTNPYLFLATMVWLSCGIASLGTKDNLPMITASEITFWIAIVWIVFR